MASSMKRASVYLLRGPLFCPGAAHTRRPHLRAREASGWAQGNGNNGGGGEGGSGASGSSGPSTLWSGVPFLGVGVGAGIAYLAHLLRSRTTAGPLLSLGSFFPTVQARMATGPPKSYNFIADVVEQTAKSVVYIEIKDNRQVDFFTGAPAMTSNGSGFIVNEDGLILTNAHVVVNRPSSSVWVKLHDGQVLAGKVEDIDTHSDLATIRISAKNLPAMQLGSSSEVRPGEWVVAMGSPLSLSNTITAGVISSINRGSSELGLRGKDMEYLQTDAAITFGNSGGPLVNLEGEAIGVNAMKVTAGISFAIPIDYAKEFLRRAEERRKDIKSGRLGGGGAKRRYMGITMLTLTPDIIYELQMKHQLPHMAVTHGVLVWKIAVGSPAYHAGIQPGDVVTHINKDPVRSTGDVYKALESETPDILLQIVRGNRHLTAVVQPEEHNT